MISFYPYELSANPLARQQTLIVPGFIDNCESRQILIDTGAAKDILFYNVYQKMGLPDSRLSPYLGHLEEFTNHRVDSKGQIDLLVDIEEHPLRTIKTVTFIVIDVISDNQAILGQPGQAALGIIASVPHQRIKFPTRSGIGCMLGTAPEFLEHVLKSKRTIEIDDPEITRDFARCEMRLSSAEGWCLRPRLLGRRGVATRFLYFEPKR